MKRYLVILAVILVVIALGLFMVSDEVMPSTEVDTSDWPSWRIGLALWMQGDTQGAMELITASDSESEDIEPDVIVKLNELSRPEADYTALSTRKQIEAQSKRMEAGKAVREYARALRAEEVKARNEGDAQLANKFRETLGAIAEWLSTPGMNAFSQQHARIVRAILEQ